MSEKFECFKCGDYTFACRGWETSRAWGHEVFLLNGASEVGRARYRYYNRTWECYRFQSAMFGAIEDYKKQELARYLNNRKIELGLRGFDENWNEFEKPWRRGEKKREVDAFEETEVAKQIKELEKFVRRDK